MTPIQILFSFKGRLNRLPYWLYIIGTQVVFRMIEMLSIEYSDIASILYIGLVIPIIWAGTSLSIKRWHDLNKSGWWLLIAVIPLAGLLFTFVELVFHAGTEGPNNYGLDPIQNRA